MDGKLYLRTMGLGNDDGVSVVVTRDARNLFFVGSVLERGGPLQEVVIMDGTVLPVDVLLRNARALADRHYASRGRQYSGYIVHAELNGVWLYPGQYVAAVQGRVRCATMDEWLNGRPEPGTG